jgi:hypothetical protein
MGSEWRSKTSSIGFRLAVGRTAAASACRTVASKRHIKCGLSAFRNHSGTGCSVSAFALLKLRLKPSLYQHQQRTYQIPHLQY